MVGGAKRPWGCGECLGRAGKTDGVATGGVFRCFLLNFLALKRDKQIARDSQLQDTARDCFYFVTKFFEPINVSAAHIYHSALELCPTSSIVRKLYYDRCHGVTRCPRVVIGTPDSWDTTISVSGKHRYGFCTWSPCGQFIAAQTGKTVEIRNHLTFELLVILRSTDYNAAGKATGTGSPIGGIGKWTRGQGGIFWDIQTGGVANEIGCSSPISSLAWSLDGSMVAITVSRWCTFTDVDVETYNVLSGEQLFTKQIEWGFNIYLWAHEKSFRLIKVPEMCPDASQTLTYTISEIGPSALIEIESSSFRTGGTPWSPLRITFSPSTYHIAAFRSNIYVYDIRTSHCLLALYGNPESPQFSPDGSHFATFSNYHLDIFQWTSDKYTLLWRPGLSYDHKSCLQFSPTLSSILSQREGILQVLRLSDLPIASETRLRSMIFSRSGRRISAFESGSEATVTTIDLHSRTPPQFIDTHIDQDLGELAITGNVLVVMGRRRAAGWLLTEEGMLDGVFDNRRASISDSKWTLDLPWMKPYSMKLRVEGKAGVIQSKHYGEPDSFFHYHIETGDVLKLAPEPQHSSPETSLETSPRGGLHHHLATPLYLTTPKGSWSIPYSSTELEAAWVIDPDGRRRFWVPVEWRKTWRLGGWHRKFTTLLSDYPPIAIKF